MPGPGEYWLVEGSPGANSQHGNSQGQVALISLGLLCLSGVPSACNAADVIFRRVVRPTLHGSSALGLYCSQVAKGCHWTASMFLSGREVIIAADFGHFLPICFRAWIQLPLPVLPMINAGHTLRSRESCPAFILLVIRKLMRELISSNFQ